MAEAPAGLDGWIGRETRSKDVAAAGTVARLAATLDDLGAAWPADVLPPLAHWLFHLPDAPQSALGPDGHPALGTNLPPMDLPRRMWAGGRLRFLAPIPFGAPIEKRTTILSIARKSEELIFLTLLHELSIEGAPALREEQDLVYLKIAPPRTPKPSEMPVAESEKTVMLDAVRLFRFSALTFNGHRIHYDAVYSREVELNPGLVVHGPLQAMLLLDHARRDNPTGMPQSFTFRAQAPLYADRGITLCRSGDSLWTRDEAGIVTMTGSVEWA